MAHIHANHALTPVGWVEGLTVAIEGGRIRLLDGPPPADARHVDLLLPAPVNLHSHSFQRAMAGLTESRGPDPSDSFWSWRRLMYRFLDRLTPEQIETIATMVFMEMLEAGFGAVAEFHYLHHAVGGVPYEHRAETAARIVAAAERTGIGLTLLPVLYMQGGCDGRALAGGQRRFGCDLDGFATLFEQSAAIVASSAADYAIGVAPHSLRAVTPEALAHVQTLAPHAPLHMHLAEQTGEVDEVSAHLGARPVTWLMDNTTVDARWCLIHCTQTLPNETDALARSGAVAGLCPITESSLGDGIFDGVRFAGAGGRFGVGSDSNIHIALWQELATLEYSQRLRDRSRAALATPDRSTGRVLFEAAVAAGSQAAGRDSGKLVDGSLADLIALETDNAVLAGRQGDALLDSLIFSGRGAGCITDVWSAGRHVVTEGRHIAHDAISSDYVAVMHALRDAL